MCIENSSSNSKSMLSKGRENGLKLNGDLQGLDLEGAPQSALDNKKILKANLVYSQQVNNIILLYSRLRCYFILLNSIKL